MKPSLPLILTIAAFVALSGCTTVPPVRESVHAESPPLTSGDHHAAMADERSAELEPEPPAAPPREPPPAMTPGSGQFINATAAAKAPSPDGAEGEVTFNFEGESLHAVVKAILGDFLQENYVIAPGVSGNVTFSTAKPLRGDQALSVLEMLLRWNNATLVWQDGRYTILPVTQAVPGNLVPRTGPAANARGYEVRAVPLQYISALEMEKVLKPYAKPEAVVYVDPARNMLVLGGTRAELENYLQTIEIFDVDWLAGMSIGMFSLQQAEAAKVVAELEKIFGAGGNTPVSGMFRFIPLEGINGVMVITPQKKYLDTIREWLERFDLGSGEAGTRLYVYDVKNVKAADLATTLGNVFGGGEGTRTGNGGEIAPGLEPVRIDSLTVPEGRTGPGVSEPANPQGPGAAGNGDISLTLGDDVRISAVEESNALIVRATAAQWESIRRVIERLDQIPLQVVIEAQIVQVTLNNNLQYGVRWFFENGIQSSGVPAGSLSTTDLRNLALGRDIWGSVGGSITGGSTSWSIVGPNLYSIINLLDEITRVTVLSAPSLVVLNNKPATINSGRQVPITTTNINLGTGGTGTPFTSTQYLETGIILNVTPRVNPGGLVFLEIDQEDSTPESAPAGQNPPINKSSIKTEVAVQSGETVLLGGLIKQRDGNTSAGLPGLSRIPIVGGLFGSKTRSTDRQELLVLITPRVIRDSTDARRITEDYRAKLRGIEPLRLPSRGANNNQ